MPKTKQVITGSSNAPTDTFPYIPDKTNALIIVMGMDFFINPNSKESRPIALIAVMDTAVILNSSANKWTDIVSVTIGAKDSVTENTIMDIPADSSMEMNIKKNTTSTLAINIFLRLTGYENSKASRFPEYSSVINFAYIVADNTPKRIILITLVNRNIFA